MVSRISGAPPFTKLSRYGLSAPQRRAVRRGNNDAEIRADCKHLNIIGNTRRDSRQSHNEKNSAPEASTAAHPSASIPFRKSHGRRCQHVKALDVRMLHIGGSGVASSQDDICKRKEQAICHTHDDIQISIAVIGIDDKHIIPASSKNRGNPGAERGFFPVPPLPDTTTITLPISPPMSPA